MKQLSIALSMLLLLAVMTYPCLAQQNSVIYACVKLDGTTRIVPTPDSCKKSEVLLSWNVQGPQGPPGDIGQPFNLSVDCAQSQSVSGALAGAGEGVANVTVNIAGFCHEDVGITRSNVTLRAVSDGDGVRSITLDGAHRIRMIRETMQYENPMGFF